MADGGCDDGAGVSMVMVMVVVQNDVVGFQRHCNQHTSKNSVSLGSGSAGHIIILMLFCSYVPKWQEGNFGVCQCVSVGVW